MTRRRARRSLKLGCSFSKNSDTRACHEVRHPEALQKGVANHLGLLERVANEQQRPEHRADCSVCTPFSIPFRYAG